MIQWNVDLDQDWILTHLSALTDLAKEDIDAWIRTFTMDPQGTSDLRKAFEEWLPSKDIPTEERARICLGLLIQHQLQQKPNLSCRQES